MNRNLISMCVENLELNRISIIKKLMVALTILMFFIGAAYTAKGLFVAWSLDGDKDLKLLWEQYQLFASGIYPSRHVSELALIADSPVHAVHPPYAFTFLSLLLWPTSFLVTRLLFEVLTFYFLGVLMMIGRRHYGGDNNVFSIIGMAIPLTFSCHSSIFGLGQLTTICVGLLAMQVDLLKRNKPYLAVLCWTFAMIKPQIAFPFLSVFLLRREWSALVLGSAILIGMSLATLAWTGVGPWEFIFQSIGKQSLKFVEVGNVGAGFWTSALGLSGRQSVSLGLTLSCIFFTYILFRKETSFLSIDSVAAISSVLAMTLFYHRHYDLLVLIFILNSLVLRAIKHKNAFVCIGSTLLAGILFLPASVVNSLILLSPIINGLIFALPIISLTLLAG